MNTKILFGVLSAFTTALTITNACLAADLVGTDGKKIGTVDTKETKTGVEFHVVASGLTPGEHGIHVHSAGKCEGPDFKSAGSHFAVEGQHHGLTQKENHHLGDLPNLMVKADGTVDMTIVSKTVSLKPGKDSLHKEGGTALVIHAGKDDQTSDPAGNSGNKIACAVL